MRLTSSFAVFRFDPGEQDLARPRWLAREHKLAEAEEEYRKALGRNPDLFAGWQELFELLRRSRRYHDALAVAEAAARHWGDAAAMPHTLRGAALVDLGRIGEGIAALQRAIELDSTLALTWHEYGYASYRAGHHGEALIALDRAFALEPHTDTLMLRGRIFRDGGRYDAAEVAFQGAMQATDHDVPRHEAEREIHATRRAAALGGKRPREFSPREQWFAVKGGILLADRADGAPLAERLGRAVAELAGLAADAGWQQSAVAGAAPDDQALAAVVAAVFGVPALGSATLDPADRPLIVTVRNDGGEQWKKQVERLDRWRSGYAFALVEPPGTDEGADVVGVGEELPDGRIEAALEAALGTPVAPAVPDPEALALAKQPLTAWRRRAVGAAA
jgi:tetratricopeptide (TPR) repeat protein